MISITHSTTNNNIKRSKAALQANSWCMLLFQTTQEIITWSYIFPIAFPITMRRLRVFLTQGILWLFHQPINWGTINMILSWCEVNYLMFETKPESPSCKRQKYIKVKLGNKGLNDVTVTSIRNLKGKESEIAFPIKEGKTFWLNHKATGFKIWARAATTLRHPCIVL